MLWPGSQQTWHDKDPCSLFKTTVLEHFELDVEWHTINQPKEAGIEWKTLTTTWKGSGVVRVCFDIREFLKWYMNGYIGIVFLFQWMDVKKNDRLDFLVEMFLSRKQSNVHKYLTITPCYFYCFPWMDNNSFDSSPIRLFQYEGDQVIIVELLWNTKLNQWKVVPSFIFSVCKVIIWYG